MTIELFKDLVMDDETRIIEEEYIQIDGLHVKHEHWIWDGVKAHTFVFLAEETSHLNLKDIKALINSQYKTIDTSTHTTKDQGKYKLFNCDFETV